MLVCLRVSVFVLRFLLICLFLLTVSPYALSATQEKPLGILNRINNAENEVTYTGTRLAVFHNLDGIIVRDELVVHLPPRVHAVKTLSVLGKHNILGLRDTEDLRVRNGRQRRSGSRERLAGRRRPLPHRKRISTLSREEIALLAQNYRIDFSSGSTIAGQETYVVKISPRFEGRPTKLLYVSRDKGIILRTEDFDPAGNLRFVSVYTQIDFAHDKVRRTLTELKNSEKIAFEGERQRSQSIKAIEAERVLGDRLIQPSYLPVGFQLLDTRHIKDRPAAVFLRYTDGLVTFSLFERRGRRFFQMPSQRPRKKGGKMIVRRDVPIKIKSQNQASILEWSNAGVDFTLIGEFDVSELIKVAESVIITPKEQ